MRGVLVVVVGIALGTGACSDESPSPANRPAAERGRQVYLAQCTACHAADPGLPGPVGPPVKGSSEAVLEAKLVRGTYPPGYTPRRPTSVMPVQPALAPEIPALAAYLHE